MVCWSLTHDLSIYVMDGISKTGKRFVMYSSQVRTIVPLNPFAAKFNFLPFCPVQSRDFLFIVPFDFEEICLVTNFTIMNVVCLSETLFLLSFL